MTLTGVEVRAEVRVVGPRAVDGVAPGGVLAIAPGRVAALVEAGHVEVVEPRPVKAKRKAEGEGGEE